MSLWTYINGTIVVEPMGRTQAEKRYILDTVLNHLPLVTGSEQNMNIYTIQKAGENSSSSCDEFGEKTNNLINSYGNQSLRNGWLQVQSAYILVTNAALRDRTFTETFREFQNWLCRLAKRIYITDVLVEIKGYQQSTIIKNDREGYSKMFEDPTWYKTNQGEPNWCEFMMWDRAKNSDYPMLLAYKYFDDQENDKEVERRMKYFKESET